MLAAVVLRLLAELRQRLGLAYLFVSHDLNVVRIRCDRVMVLYLGRLCEVGPADVVLATPPATRIHGRSSMRSRPADRARVPFRPANRCRPSIRRPTSAASPAAARACTIAAGRSSPP